MDGETHPTREVFIAYLRGTLSQGSYALEEHVEYCEPCEIMLATLRPMVAIEQRSIENEGGGGKI